MPQQNSKNIVPAESSTPGQTRATTKAPGAIYSICFHDTEFLPWQEATIHTHSLAMRYALSVFEGIRLYEQQDGTGVRPFRQELHLNRLQNSMRLMRLTPLGKDVDVAGITGELIRRNSIVEDSYVRVSVSPKNFGDIGSPTESSLSILITKMGRKRWLKEGRAMRIAINGWQRSAELAFPVAAKNISNYAGPRLALLQARDGGFDSAVLLNHEGFLCESPTAALFVVRNGVVITPPLSEGVLPSITRLAVLEICEALGIEAREARLSRADAHLADEAFLCGTGLEFGPIGEFDGHLLKPWTESEITPRIINAYFRLVRGQTISDEIADAGA